MQQTLVWASQLLGQSIDLAEKSFAPSNAGKALKPETPAGEASIETGAAMLKISVPQQHSTATTASGHAACHDEAERQALPGPGSLGCSSPDCPTIDHAAGQCPQQPCATLKLLMVMLKSASSLHQTDKQSKQSSARSRVTFP